MKRLIILALATTLSAAALAQTWKTSYQAGLDAVHNGQWADAREDFQFAAGLRPGDIAKPTTESSNAFHKSYWRNASPYSPEFLGAYAGLKESLLLSGESRTYLLTKVAKEFERLINQGQYSIETFFFLDEAYALLGETNKRYALADQYTEVSATMTWKIDKAGIDPADKALIAQLPSPAHAQARNAFYKPAPSVSMTDKPAAKVETAHSDIQPQKPAPAPIQTPSISAGTLDIQVEKPASDTHQQPDPETKIPQAPVQDKAAGPTAPATVPATPNIEPDHDIPTGTVQAPATTPSIAPPAPTTTAEGSVKNVKKPKKEKKTAEPAPEPAKPADKPASSVQPETVTATPAPRHGKKHGHNDEAQPVTAPTADVQPIEIKKIENPAPTKNSKKAISTTVPVISSKYALIIGNSESKMEGGSLAFAGDDAQVLRQTLTENAGYDDQNVEVVVNGTAAQIAATVNALAGRIGDKGTVFVYFTGVGVNIDGKDYLAGVDSDVANDGSTMIAKDDVYKAFMLKGARIYAFFQCNRPIQDGHFFGSELPLVGSISQMQATLPGQSVYGINTDGKLTGLFTHGFVNTLKDIRSNQTPILDFGWQLFYSLRRGDTGTDGGSSNQSPSLPVLTNMASDARF